MASNKKKAFKGANKVKLDRAIMGDQNFNTIGTYQESTGGGTPLKKGEKLKDHPEAHRVQQPRDENGQFTYNAANAKPLKYGPSRGETIPPYLRNVDLTAIVKKTNAVVYNGLTYLAGIKMSAQTILNKFKEWNNGGFGSLNRDVDRKKGRKTDLEKQAISQGKQGIAATKEQKTETTPKGGLITIHAKDTFMQKLTGNQQRFKGKKVNPAGFKKTQPTQPTKPAAPTAPSKPVQPAAPSTPNNPTQPSTPSTPAAPAKSNKIDSNLAKTNPKQFINDNYDSINEIVELADKKGFDLDIDDLMDTISQGKINSFDEIKEMINNI